MRQRKHRMAGRGADAETRPMSRQVWILIALLALLWGGSFFFVGVAVRDTAPLVIVLARVGLAAVTLWGAVLALGLELRSDGPAWRAHLGMGLLNNALPFTLIVWAQSPGDGGGLPSGVASILNATTPLWAVVMAHAMGAERATGRRTGGVLAGFLGVAVVFAGDVTAAPAASVFAMLAATFCYAGAGLWGRRFKQLGIAPLMAAAGQTSVATLLLVPLLFWFSPPWAAPAPGLTTLGALLGLALLSTALAYFLYFRILDLAGPVNLLLVTLLIPVVAIAFGVLVLGERLGAQHAAGLCLMAFGLALIDGRMFRRAGNSAEGVTLRRKPQ